MSFLSDWFTHPRFQEVANGQGLIRRGHRGEPVKVLQQALVGLGHAMPVSTDSGSADGIFGSETDRCVRNFQQVAIPGQSPDGKVGPITLGKLDSSLASIPSPNNSSDDWRPAPAPVPGRPKEFDMGPNMGWHRAIKQVHPMACWAACLSFWGRYCGGGRPRLDQSDIISMYADSVAGSGEQSGGIRLSALREIMQDNTAPLFVEDGHSYPSWRGSLQSSFAPSSFTKSWLKANAGGPYQALLLGYKINGAAHINVVGHYDFDGETYVWVMEPWVGRFKLREVTYYQGAQRMYYASPTS